MTAATLLLTRSDVSELLDMDVCIAAVEEAFRLEGEGRAPRADTLSVVIQGCRRAQHAQEALGRVLQRDAGALEQEDERRRRAVEDRHFLGGDVDDEVVDSPEVVGVADVVDVLAHGSGHEARIREALSRAALDLDRLGLSAAGDADLLRLPSEAIAGHSGRTAEAAVARFRPIPDQPTLAYIADHVAATSIRPAEGGWTWKFDPNVFARDHLTPELLTRLDCRVALFRAEHGLITPQQGEVLYDRLGRVAPVIEIPVAGHHIMLDQPVALVAALRTLLADWDHSIPHR